MRRITSRRNILVERYREAARGEIPALLLDGPHLVQEALGAGLHVVSAVIAAHAGNRPDVQALLARLASQPIDVALGSPAVMAAVSPVRSPSSVVALAEHRPLPLDAPYAARPPLVVVACDVQDPGNLGAIVRVAEAAGASGIVAAGACANPFGWKALRGSMGSALRLPIVRQTSVDEAVAQAKRHRCRVVATGPRDGANLFLTDLTGPLAVLLGSEGAGLPPAAVDGADVRIVIPMAAPVESLNTAIAAALVVYEARRQRQQARS